MSEWLQLALDGGVVRRALRTALVVGAVLIGINHGDALLRGDVDGARLFRICLTLFVPYGVSTTSSVAALRSASEGRKRRGQ
ncbi:MAG TPA: nitrate/nitrite transporter NrtS [Myxococcota bacterium]|nr:nitrate/nitrite transporter NrtS [Myxococcota bacterium]